MGLVMYALLVAERKIMDWKNESARLSLRSFHVYVTPACCPVGGSEFDVRIDEKYNLTAHSSGRFSCQRFFFRVIAPLLRDGN